MTIAAALGFTATVTPFEVALLPPQLDGLFVINRIVDLIFMADIAVNFLLIHESHDSSSRGSEWIISPKLIARGYVLSWFSLDLFAVAVSAIDIVIVVIASGSSDGEESVALLSNLVMLKVLRVLRLFKLARLLKSSSIGKRWETRVSLSFSVMSLLKNLVVVIIFAHWMACIWVLQAYLQYNTMDSWLGDRGYGYCRWNDPSVHGGSALKFVECEPAGTVYMASLYFAVATLTSVGYGDIGATSGNPGEQAICSLLMLLSALLWAHVIGTYCGVISTFNPELNAFQANMDELNRFLDRENVQPSMRHRLREYFHRSRHLRFSQSQHRLLASMPPTLQREVTWEITQSWLRTLSFLDHASYQFMVDFAQSLKPMVYAPSDTPANGYMYIVHRGLALYRGKILVKGRAWGEDIILSNPKLRSRLQARAMNYLEVYFMQRRDLLLMAARYPKMGRRMRRLAVLIALRRHVIAVAKVKLMLGPNELLSARNSTAEAIKMGMERAFVGRNAKRRQSLMLSERLMMASMQPDGGGEAPLNLHADLETVPVGSVEASKYLGIDSDQGVLDALLSPMPAGAASGGEAPSAAREQKTAEATAAVLSSEVDIFADESSKRHAQLLQLVEGISARLSATEEGLKAVSVAASSASDQRIANLTTTVERMASQMERLVPSEAAQPAAAPVTLTA